MVARARRGSGTLILSSVWIPLCSEAFSDLYRITMNAYYSSWHQYFPFDNVRISIAQ